MGEINGYRWTLRVWLLVLCAMAGVMLFWGPAVHAQNIDEGDPLEGADSTGVEDGAIKQHELFEFEAFINHDDVADGTAPFENNNDAGNDADDKNKIVRAWDTATYPLKVTVNPKKADTLEKIELRITGTLENGITDGRVNARFAIDGKEDLETSTVSFDQRYTIERTGTSIMIPVTIEVQGTKHGLELTPNIKVQVVSVEGKNISKDDVSTTFDTLPSVTTSSRVSIKPIVNGGLSGQGIPYFPMSGITGDKTDLANSHAFVLSWGVVNLPGKNHIKGATFPDPNGVINYEVSLNGHVAWDYPAKTEPLNFTGRDEPFVLLDHVPIGGVSNRVGNKNTYFEGQSYTYRYIGQFSGARSSMTPAQRVLESYHDRSVLDSGEWEVSKPSITKDNVTYTGTNKDFVLGSTFPRYRADGYRGGYLYGVNEKIFSTNGFLVRMPNEYYVGGPNNKEGKANNVNYKATVKMISYTDANGKTTPFENQRTGAVSFTERNNPDGSYSIQNTMFGNPGGAQIGTPNIGWGEISKGDASVLTGMNVYHNTAIGSSVMSYGGYRIVMRWNTDGFELTPEYAAQAETNIYQGGYWDASINQVRNNRDMQNVTFGVAKFPKADNVFEVFTQKGIYDYDWYDTYEEAVKHGPVGAMQSDVTAVTGPKWTTVGRIPLRVKHENIGIGSFTKDGSANITITNAYVYPSENRVDKNGNDTWVDLSRHRAYHNPAKWNADGVMEKKQSPSGSTINFETLGVTPAQLATVLSSEKSTYYNSEVIQWTAKNSIVLPDSGVPDELDAGVTITHSLPQGLDYQVGSGTLGGVAVEPEVTMHEDGTKTLTWQTLVSNTTRDIPQITFRTSINPLALSSGVQSSVAIKSVITSELDKRPEHLRSHNQSVTITKVGMVGIHETIQPNYGKKNSAYTIVLKPYTTVDEEHDVQGLTHLPKNGDPLGSSFKGSAVLSSIKTSGNDTVRIFLNNRRIETNEPHKLNLVDGLKDGWYEYKGGKQDVSKAQSLYFIVEGVLKNTDDVRIEYGVKTQGNHFGDFYENETVINSSTNYKLSPISNRVRYQIRADLELKLERFQIYTNKASSGLPTSIRVNQVVLSGSNVKDLPITLAIYDKESGDKVVEKTYKQSELQNENKMTIPTDGLEKGDVREYEARIEAYDPERVWVRDGEGSIVTEGHTAQEGTLTEADANADGLIAFKGVTMTERELHGDMKVFNETLSVPVLDTKEVKAGYGFDLQSSLDYHNEALVSVMSHVPTVKTVTEMDAHVPYELMDTTLEYVDDTVIYASGDKLPIRLLFKDRDTVLNGTARDYQLPELYLEQGTGLTYSANQVANGEVKREALHAGHQLFVPVWLDELDTYEIDVTNETALGSHFMHVELEKSIDVSAYMFHHVDSNSPNGDEILIHPIEQDKIPPEWELGKPDEQE